MYHQEDSDYRRYDKKEKQFKKDDERMKLGKSFKDYMNQKPLRKGEVKKWDKNLKKYVSNKD